MGNTFDAPARLRLWKATGTGVDSAEVLRVSRRQTAGVICERKTKMRRTVLIITVIGSISAAASAWALSPDLSGPPSDHGTSPVDQGPPPGDKGAAPIADQGLPPGEHGTTAETDAGTVSGDGTQKDGGGCAVAGTTLNSLAGLIVLIPFAFRRKHT